LTEQNTNDSPARDGTVASEHPSNCVVSVPAPILWALYIATALLLLTFLGRTAASWKNYTDLDHNSVGTAVTLAADARDGVLYRPIYSGWGFGGTRYAPLSPVIQASLMRAGMDPVFSGYVVSVAAAILVLAGLFALMRSMGVPSAIAAALTAVVLGTSCFRTTVLEIKPDLLPLGLNLWGLVLIANIDRPKKPSIRNLAITAGAICFALALVAKFSSIFGIAAATLWLLSQRRIPLAVTLCAVWLVAVVALIGTTQWLSDGRAIAIFRLCGGGGGGLYGIRTIPWHFYDEAFHYDRPFLAFGLIALTVVIVTRAWISLPSILLLVTALGTGAILASPGTRFNHLVDLTAAALLVIAVLGLRSVRFGSIVLVGVAGIAVMTSIASWRQVSEINRYAARTKMEAALADTDQSPVDGPILSEDPLLPILRNQRPYMLDPFMFRVLRFKDSSLTDRMWDELAHHKFRAVILHEAPTSDLYTDPADGNLGPGFVEQMEKYYYLAGHHGKFHVFLPRTSENPGQ
jgi:hypothetical protein